MPLPGSSIGDDDYLRDLDEHDTAELIERFPGVRPSGTGAGRYVWLGDGEAGLMELSTSSDGSAFVGHAKLEPLLALHAALEASRPGWFLVDVGTYTLHDPASLRREYERRQSLADALRSRRGA